MHCLILFRNASGWLPTAQELRRCGFLVSCAAMPAHETRPQGASLALAAETAEAYGVKPAAALPADLPEPRGPLAQEPVQGGAAPQTPETGRI